MGIPRHTLRLCLLGLLLGNLAASSLQASHPVISGYERLLAIPPENDVLAGEILLTELNCTSCHAPDPGTLAPKQAPILAQLSARVKPSYLGRFLLDPQACKPGATMPQLFQGKPPQESQQEVQALVHFLVSLGPGAPAQQFPTMGASQMGERLYHEVGCAACHGSRRDGDPPLAADKPLGELMEKYTLPSLVSFLRDPLQVRPSGRMPDLNLAVAEADAIAAYLLKGLPEVARIQYSYYEGSWSEIPDFAKLKPAIIGSTDRIDVSLSKRVEHFGLRFEGFLKIAEEGEYTFHLGSDDGSKLLLDGKPVIEHGGIHGYSAKSGKIKLSAGYHSLLVDFFEQAGEERLTLEYEGPGLKRQPVANAMSHVKEPPEAEDLSFPVNPKLADRGRQLFSSLGCAACHALQDQGQQVASALKAKDLKRVDPSRGCLSENPSGAAPHYSLTSRQRQALSAAIKQRRAASSLTPQSVVHRTLASFNCYACHERDEVGGVEPERNSLFTSTIPEMGDEGRLPPTLTGVGGKLTDKYLDAILANGAEDRPYMLTRMPKFGAKNVGHLRPLLSETDRLQPLPAADFSEPLSKVKRQGRGMVGARGFACIKCHTFGQYRATGIQSIDMKAMSERLREAWFRRYLRNPQVFRPGTRMPSAWPNDRSLLPKILQGSSEQQIAAVWAYLSDGKRAGLPEGLVTASMELIPIDDAVIYRNFIQGAGPRAIGVGYPEGVSLAFDANDMRLALIWQGRFMDASLHWSGRGAGFQPPLGQNVLSLPSGATFASLSSAEQPWPTEPVRSQGYRFRGYRLDSEQRPTFRYAYGDIQIEDFPQTANPNDEPLRRVYTLKSTGAVSNLWMRAAAADSIKSEDGGWYSVGDNLRMRLKSHDSDAKAAVRKSGNQMELLLPVEFKNGAARIEQTYVW